MKWTMPARPLGEPVADQLGLVARRVVHDDVDVEVGGHVSLDLIEESAELRVRGGAACTCR